MSESVTFELESPEEKAETRRMCIEMLSMYFDEADEIKAAHLLYEDFRAVRPDISKFQFYLVAMYARGGHDGTAADGNLGWSIALKKEQPPQA